MGFSQVGYKTANVLETTSDSLETRPEHEQTQNCSPSRHRASKRCTSNRQMRLMTDARASATFDPLEISYLLYGGEAFDIRQAAFRQVEEALGTSDSSKLPTVYANMDRVDSYYEGLKYGKVLMEDQVAHRHGVFDRATHTHTLINSSPFGLHPAMFVPSLKLQASQEQLDHWLPLAESGRIIGTYCQTELGHGTFVRGLETTATFDPATDEFIFHSPTLTSTKFWPGGLGFSCSHAIVMARLIISSTDHGVHPFIVQLRSLEDYRPLPGIELGDLGLKMGLNCTDNGFAVFNRVRIPRTHLLMRNARVLRDGTYVKAPHDKLAYSTMIFTRNLIIHTVSFQLAQAVTIATRYSVVREQGVGNDSKSTKDVSIMSYRSQHLRLLTLMARAFALVFSSQHCETLYQNLISSQLQGKHSALSYVHITTAALKAYSTRIAAEGAEDARKCCGGHGYLMISGLPDIVTTVTPTTTLEGENYVMLQQAARYLVKCAAKVRMGKIEEVDEPMMYLVKGYASIQASGDDEDPWTREDFLDPQVVLNLFQARAVRLIFEAEELLHESQDGPDALSPTETWNEHLMSLISAAEAHVELFVLRSYISTLTSASLSPASMSVLTNLLTLFTHSCLVSSPSFLSHSPLKPMHLPLLKKNISSALKALLPNCIGLTDAWAFSDASLQSALGMRDGNVYERIMEWTRQAPINMATRKTERKAFEGFVRPIIQSKL